MRIEGGWGLGMKKELVFGVGYRLCLGGGLRLFEGFGVLGGEGSV
jgi:hypothetical protein